MLRFLLLTCSLITAACAGGGDGPRGDGGSGGEDGGEIDPGGDAGGVTCPSGQHRCGGGCIDDRPNEPEEGCRFGCGEPCPTPEGGVAACTEDGMCDFTCTDPWVRGPDGCSCAPTTCEALGAMCGDHDDGCGGTVACGACADGTACIDGTCGCMEDAGEPNDVRAVPHTLPNFTDDPDTAMTFDMFNVSSDVDEDWYVAAVADDFDGGNPQITVTLDGIPAGSDYDLGAWYACGSGGDDSSCTAGATDNKIGRGCVSESADAAMETVGLDTNCSGSDDGGNLYIRVVARTWMAACSPYSLAVSVN